VLSSRPWRLPYKNVVAYTTMITLLGKRRRVHEARDLFLQLAASGLPLDVVVYNALLDALATGRGRRGVGAQSVQGDAGAEGPRPPSTPTPSWLTCECTF